MASLKAEIENLLREAHTAGLGDIAADCETVHVAAESFDAVATVERHRW